MVRLASTKELDANSIFGEESVFGDDGEELKEATMVGVDVSASGGDVAVVVGELKAGTQHFGGETSTLLRENLA